MSPANESLPHENSSPSNSTTNDWLALKRSPPQAVPRRQGTTDSRIGAAERQEAYVLTLHPIGLSEAMPLVLSHPESRIWATLFLVLKARQETRQGTTDSRIGAAERQEASRTINPLNWHSGVPSVFIPPRRTPRGAARGISVNTPPIGSVRSSPRVQCAMLLATN